MEKKIKYTKREKEILSLLDKVILGLKDQKNVWSKLLKKYNISNKELENMRRNEKI